MFAIGLQRIFSFRRILPPVLCCSPKQHDSLEADLMTEMRPGHLRGYYPLWPAVSTTSYTQRPVGTRSSRPQFPHPRGGDYLIELFPLHSPLLGESLLVSFPPLNNMLKFSGSSYLSSALVLAFGIAAERTLGDGVTKMKSPGSRPRGSPAAKLVNWTLAYV